MSYEQFRDYRQQFQGSISSHRGPEEREQRQPRNSVKRPRGYSPPAFGCTASPPTDYPIAKRFRGPIGKISQGGASNSGGFFFTTRSDDEISLSEEAQTTPTALPHHSIFTQDKQNHHYRQSVQTYQHQNQSQVGLNQTVNSINSPTGMRSANNASGTSYATDYQPMNNLLGNLHLMRQQRRQTSVQSIQQQAQVQNHSAVIPQQPHHHNRQNGNYHTVPKTLANNNKQGTNQSRKKTVSLRVSSNLY